MVAGRCPSCVAWAWPHRAHQWFEGFVTVVPSVLAYIWLPESAYRKATGIRSVSQGQLRGVVRYNQRQMHRHIDPPHIYTTQTYIRLNLVKQLARLHHVTGPYALLQSNLTPLQLGGLVSNVGWQKRFGKI